MMHGKLARILMEVRTGRNINNGVMPVVHENGFIQWDLGDGERLHVWASGLIKQATDSPIHDHRFSFTSRVLLGELVHTRHDVEWTVKAPTHRVHHVVDGRLTPSIQTVVVKAYEAYRMPAGSLYRFPAGCFHESTGVGLTATIMQKEAIHQEHTPRVLCPEGQIPDNEYDRRKANPQGQIMEAIMQVLTTLEKQ